MISVSKGVLKAKMLAYFRHIEKTKEGLIVTDHNRPVLRILPYSPLQRPTDVFKNHKKVIYHEDLTTPTRDEWEAL